MGNRRKCSPEEQTRREKIRELLQVSGISSMGDIQNPFKESIAEFMENGLEAELDDELDCSKYDHLGIETHIRDIYGVEVSDTTVSRITDKILPVAKEWQQRPLEVVYAVVFLGAIHYHVRSEGQIIKKVVYIAIGIDLEGRKDVLGMWVGENESAKFWVTVLNGLKNRGI